MRSKSEYVLTQNEKKKSFSQKSIFFYSICEARCVRFFRASSVRPSVENFNVGLFLETVKARIVLLGMGGVCEKTFINIPFSMISPEGQGHRSWWKCQIMPIFFQTNSDLESYSNPKCSILVPWVTAFLNTFVWVTWPKGQGHGRWLKCWKIEVLKHKLQFLSKLKC